MKSLKDNLKQAGYALFVAGALLVVPNALNYISTKKYIESQSSDKVKLEVAYKRAGSVSNSDFFTRCFFAGSYIAAKEACKKYENVSDNLSN